MVWLYFTDWLALAHSDAYFANGVARPQLIQDFETVVLNLICGLNVIRQFVLL